MNLLTFLFHLLLKFFRRTITQSGVQSLLVVIPLDEFLDVAPQMFQVLVLILVLVGEDLFPLQRLDMSHLVSAFEPQEHGSRIFEIRHAAI